MGRNRRRNSRRYNIRIGNNRGGRRGGAGIIKIKKYQKSFFYSKYLSYFCETISE
jgi:hypothetical protein